MSEETPAGDERTPTPELPRNGFVLIGGIIGFVIALVLLGVAPAPPATARQTSPDRSTGQRGAAASVEQAPEQTAIEPASTEISERSTQPTTRLAAPAPSSPPPAYTPSSPSYTPSYSGDGTVHVRGYYRKNGTYVQPYTRRAPRRR
jgi:hypothetical protein